jgi:hypothetical protein
MSLSDEGRRIVDQARAAYAPSDADLTRVRALLSARVGASAAAAGFLGGKGVAVGLAALVVIGGASVGYWRSRTETRPRAPSVPTSAALAPAAPSLPEPEPAPALAAAREAQPAARSNRSRSTAAAREPGTDVAGEIALLNDAQRALANGQPDRALALLERHARQFPRGSLTEERAAARIIALCDLGRVTAARAETAAFVRQFPSSPLTDRVRAACAIEK